ncbi:MAG: ABC transporter permease [Planctomycetota bacterium]
MALVPLQYNIRSLHQRRSATLLTVLSIAATVAVLAGMLALQQGFSILVQERGRSDLAVMMRPGAKSEGESIIGLEAAQILVKETPEIAQDEQGRPLAAAEMFLAVSLEKAFGGKTNVPIRGVQPATFAIHGDDVRILQGRRPTPGSDELIVGSSIADRIRDCHVGDVLMLNVTPFRVVGIFKGRGGFDSELWGDADRLQHALQRQAYSRVIAVLRPGTDVEAMARRLADDPRVPTKVLTERAYLSSQTAELAGMLGFLGAFLATIMGIGAVFTGTNAMLSSIGARTHEVGILLATGFRPFSIFLSFLFEALVLGLLGGLAGCLLVLPLNGMRTGTMNFATFTEIAFAFRTTTGVLICAVSFAMVLGIVGGAIPAWRAARMMPTRALRRG